MGMRALFLFFFLVAFSTGYAQRSFNVYLTMAPTLSTGTRFTDGSREFTSATNKTGKNTLYPLYSVLDGFPNPQLSFKENLARKFTWGILLEKYINEKYSFNLGFEVGSRGYKLNSEASVSSLISYRNFSAPVYFSRYYWLGTFWSLKFNYGGHINYSYSTPKSNKVVKINRSPEQYPTLGGGLEMAYMGKEGKLSFELAYYHGWRNIIDHVYIGVDNLYGERIVTNGSHARICMKYNFKRLGMDKKKKKNRELERVEETVSSSSLLTRETKEPQVLEVKSRELSICFLDDQTVDGDSIQLMWNDSLIQAPLGLDKTPVCLTVRLDRTRNTLVVHALNEGKIKPNTYEIRVFDGEEPLVVRMKSDLLKSAVLELVWKP